MTQKRRTALVLGQNVLECLAAGWFIYAFCGALLKKYIQFTVVTALIHSVVELYLGGGIVWNQPSVPINNAKSMKSPTSEEGKHVF